MWLQQSTSSISLETYESNLCPNVIFPSPSSSLFLSSSSSSVQAAALCPIKTSEAPRNEYNLSSLVSKGTRKTSRLEMIIDLGIHEKDFVLRRERYSIAHLRLYQYRKWGLFSHKRCWCVCNLPEFQSCGMYDSGSVSMHYDIHSEGVVCAGMVIFLLQRQHRVSETKAVLNL